MGSSAVSDQELREEQAWQDFFEEGSCDLDFYQRHAAWYNKSYQDFGLFCCKRFHGQNLRVAEIGAGSGRMSYALEPLIDNLTLIDIAPNALRYAERVCPSSLRNRTDFVRRSLFDIPYSDNAFDLVHSTGVLEHYNHSEFAQAHGELMRTVRVGGHVMHLLPNPCSLAVLRARILGSNFGRRFLSHSKGYRNGSERNYTPATVRALTRGQGIYRGTFYFGSVLPTETAPRLVDLIHRYTRLSRFSFLFGVLFEK